MVENWESPSFYVGRHRVEMQCSLIVEEPGREEHIVRCHAVEIELGQKGAVALNVGCRVALHAARCLLALFPKAMDLSYVNTVEPERKQG